MASSIGVSKFLPMLTPKTPLYLECWMLRIALSIPILLKKNNFLKLKKILICGFGVGLSISVGVLI